MASLGKPRGRLFRKYVVLFVTLVSGALLTSGLTEIYFSYQENKSALVSLQREKAVAAASRIEQFVDEVERQIAWTTKSTLAARSAAVDQRRFDYIRLLGQALAITEISHLDAAGLEQLRISRLAMDVVGSRTDFSQDPKFVEAKARRIYYSPVSFRKDSEPYLTIAMAGSKEAGVTVAEVNLKFIWEVVFKIKIGKAGHAWVVDSRGQLIAHPDISLVLQKTDLSSLTQVKAAMAGGPKPGEAREEVTIAHDLAKKQVLTAFAPVAPLGWSVFVEQPLVEAFEPLYASIYRTAGLLVLGLLLSLVASLFLARRMVTPIRALQAGAGRIGAGDLGHRIEVKTGDELEALAAEFNQTAAQLQESYATLEQKVEERTRELSESLDQQTATSEILRVMSGSPTDVQPVFEAIVESAARLCEARNAQIFRVEGDRMRLVARCGPVKSTLEAGETRAITRGSVSGRVILDARAIHLHDLLAEVDAEFPDIRAAIQREGIRTTVGIPLLREGAPIGAVTIDRTEVRPFSDKQVALLQTFADQAVIAIENVRLFKELQTRNTEITEALEQQTATGEVLRVISGSPNDLTPVFDTILESSMRLCEAQLGLLFRHDGAAFEGVAFRGLSPEGMERFRGPARPGPHTGLGRLLVERRPVHIPDLTDDPAFRERDPMRMATVELLGARTFLAVPLLKEGAVIGALVIYRREVRPFSDKQIELVRTFADQAVIAIENVRLFQELERRNREVTEALEQQTATSEILRVISSSPTDLQPVFEAIVESAARLCGARFSALYRYDGELVHVAAHHNLTPEVLALLQRLYPMRPTREIASGRAILSAAVVHLPDALADPDYRHEFAIAGGWGSLLAVPMMREGRAVGTINIYRAQAAPFPENQIELLKTFADQAVIAIENVRLFTELQEKNRQVTEALEQQTATAEVLRVISSSPTDVQPVFDTIIQSAVRLCDGVFGALFRYDGRVLDLGAHHNVSVEALSTIRRAFPMPPTRASWTGKAILDGTIVHVHDLARDPEFAGVAAAAPGIGTIIAVPMLRDGMSIGTINIARPDIRPFSDNEVELLQTFADQAVIAIENVRLFQELERRTQDLGQSLEETGALSEVIRAVSSSLDLRQILDTVARRALALSGADGCGIFEFNPGRRVFEPVVTHNLSEAFLRGAQTTPIELRGATIGRAAETGQPVQIADIELARDYALRDIALGEGFRALLAVPMGGEEATRGMVLFRRTPGLFDDRLVTLLTALANQSKVAIENARLFREIEDKSRQLEVASRHKSEFLANMSHELRTPLNAIIGFSEVLGDQMFGDVNEKQAEYLQDILSSGRHLLSLINDILDLSKIEAGRMDLDLGPFDLPAALENALTLVRERAARHGIRVDLSVDDRLGEIVGDERKIKQILLNLLSNAVKFTPEGGRVGLRAALADGSVEVSVSDTGIGIAPEDQDAIFEEFRQVGGDYAQKREGTGLGLSLAKRFVELHGGAIWVKSVPGKGSTFTFSLPLRPRPRAEAEHTGGGGAA